MKKKFNPVPKSLRDKKRYILIDKDDANIKDTLHQEINNLYGILGTARMGLKFEKNNIIRVNLDFLGELIFAINYTNLRFDKKISVIRISGTIEGLDL